MTPAQFKTWRRAMGYTQAQASEALHVSRWTVIQWEANRLRGPLPTKLWDLCGALLDARPKQREAA